MANDARISTTDSAIISSRSVKPQGPGFAVRGSVRRAGARGSRSGIREGSLAWQNPESRTPNPESRVLTSPETRSPKPEARLFSSPIGIRGPIQCPALALGIDVENVLATPATGVWVVLHGAHPPVPLSRHGIHGDLAQELVLGRSRSFQLHALHQGVEIGRVTEAVGLGRNHAAVGEVLVAINRLAQIAQVSPQLELTQPLGVDARQRQGDAREEQH